LLDERREDENVFQLFRGDVLALRKFEYVLGAVNDLYCAIRENFCNITSSEPALFIKCFCCLVVTEEVALENRRTLHANLTSWIRLVGRQVLHFRNIFKSDSQIRNWSTDMTSIWIFCFRHARASRRFSKSITLLDTAAEADLKVIENCDVDWGGSSNHDSDATT